MLAFAPVLGLGLAPIAVFFRPTLWILSIWLFAGLFRFAPPRVLALERVTRRWAWVLRFLGLVGASLITENYDGFRVVVIAAAAAVLRYGAGLRRWFELSGKPARSWAAWMAFACCALLIADAALRQELDAARWGAWPSHVISLLGLPALVLAWMDVDAVARSGSSAKPQPTPAAAHSIEPHRLVLPFFLGASIVAVSLVAGFTYSWDQADLDPGVMRAATSFAMLCLDGVLLVCLRRWWRDAVRPFGVGVGLAQVPLWWLLVFPTQFEVTAWRNADVGSDVRGEMAEDLVYSRYLVGMTREQVRHAIGSPFVENAEGRALYTLHGRPCAGIRIDFKGCCVDGAKLVLCD